MDDYKKKLAIYQTTHFTMNEDGNPISADETKFNELTGKYTYFYCCLLLTPSYDPNLKLLNVFDQPYDNQGLNIWFNGLFIHMNFTEL